MLRTKRLRTTLLSLLCLLSLGTANQLVAAPDLGESLDYTLRFRGLVTGFVELDIAKLTLSVGPRLEEVGNRSVYFTRMHLTTEPYKKAELIYPVRLDYRSWLDRQTLQPLIASKRLRTGEEKRELFWFNGLEGEGVHYQTPKTEASPAGPAPPQGLLRLAAIDDTDWGVLREDHRVRSDSGDLIDYMGMLHRLRRLPLETGRWFEFTVYSGKELEYYRAQVASGHLRHRGWDRQALHVKLYEYDPEEDELKDEVQLWLSDDDQRLLLRFYAESTAGALEGILETGRPENGHLDQLPDATRRSLEAYLDF